MDPEVKPDPKPDADPDATPAPRAAVRRKSVLREYLEAILIAVLLALLIRTFVVQAFKIPSGSMIPSLQVGDHILVNKFIYRFRDPGRGDVIVFKYPVDESRDFIKRVIAVGGEDLYIKGQEVYINCQPPETGCRPLEEPWAYYDERPVASETFGPVHVPPDAYFVMGDNRNNSQDSRFWGFVRREKVKGKAFIIYWSWDGETGSPLWEKVRWSRLGRLIP
ncbi:MAG: signal peptidase I [Candidatus Rokubacteria bacterium]|nr:signal peptidase I [Candidatus Rokubacteria bacterium]